MARRPGPQSTEGPVKGTELKAPPSPPKTGDESPFDRWLEDALRDAYSSVLDEPVPADLVKLLQQKLKD